MKNHALLYCLKVFLTTVLITPIVTFGYAAISAGEGNPHFLNYMMLIAYYGLIYTIPSFALLIILSLLLINRPISIYIIKGLISIAVLMLIFSVPNPMPWAEDFVLASIYSLVTMTFIWIYRLKSLSNTKVKNGASE